MPVASLLVLVLLVAGGERRQDPARVRARGGLPARAAGRARAGPGVIYVIPGIEKAHARRPAHGHHGRAAAGRDHQGQRLGEGERGALLPRRRSEPRASSRWRTTSSPRRSSRRRRCAASAARPSSTSCSREREKINAHLQAIIDPQTEPWGIKVVQVEIKHIDLPQEMQRAMARQAEAERERRAKVINAEGEFQAAQRLAEAAAIMATRADRAAAALPADAHRDRDREQLDDDLPGADRPPAAAPRGRRRPRSTAERRAARGPRLRAAAGADRAGAGAGADAARLLVLDRATPPRIAHARVPELPGAAARRRPAGLQRHAGRPGAAARPAAERRPVELLLVRARAATDRVGGAGARRARASGERVHLPDGAGEWTAALGDGRWRLRLDGRRRRARLARARRRGAAAAVHPAARRARRRRPRALPDRVRARAGRRRGADGGPALHARRCSRRCAPRGDRARDAHAARRPGHVPAGPRRRPRELPHGAGALRAAARRPAARIAAARAAGGRASSPSARPPRARSSRRRPTASSRAGRGRGRRSSSGPATASASSTRCSPTSTCRARRCSCWSPPSPAGSVLRAAYAEAVRRALSLLQLRRRDAAHVTRRPRFAVAAHATPAGARLGRLHAGARRRSRRRRSCRWRRTGRSRASRRRSSTSWARRSCSRTPTTCRCAPASRSCRRSAACTASWAGTARSSPTAAASR